MGIQIPAGDDVHCFNTIVEIPMHGGEIKYEYDKERGLLTVDRFMPTAMRYPCNYGFVPSTLAEDGDPLDVLIVAPDPVQPGALIQVRAIGALCMEDEKGSDDKILAVPIKEACIDYQMIEYYTDVSKNLLEIIWHFFEHYKDLEPNKFVKVIGWKDMEYVKTIWQKAIVAFEA